MPDTDVSDLDIEHLNIEMVIATQIVEFISRNELDLGRLVEGILIAQGYRTRVSPFGDDGSIDIMADGGTGPLGFKLPRITVLVKPSSEMADPDAAELEAFMALSGAAQGLFVSWIGFTDAAQKEAGRLFHQAKFWDVTQIIVELVANYEKLSDGLKSELPLKRIWILDQRPNADFQISETVAMRVTDGATYERVGNKGRKPSRTCEAETTRQDGRLFQFGRVP